MAGFIRYRLPGDKPRRRAERERPPADVSSWNPPAIAPDTAPDLPDAPRYGWKFAFAAGGGVGLLSLSLWWLWMIFGATPGIVLGGSVIVALTVVLVVRMRRPRRGRGGGIEDNPRAGVGQVYLRLAHAVGLGVLATLLGIFAEGFAVAFAAVLAVAAVIWPLHAFLRYRRFRQIGEQADEDANADMLLE